MSKETERQGENVPDVVALLSLVGALSIEYYEIVAKRSGGDDEVNEGEEITASPDFTLSINRRENDLVIRLKVEFETQVGLIAVEAGAAYELPSQYVVPSSVAFEFANKVGILALVPYLREAVHNITLKVFGNGLVMPILRAGELEFFESELVESESEAE